jgi:hypothetical protein
MKRMSVVVGVLLLTAVDAGAQPARDARISLALSGGVASVPDALGEQCGRNGGGSGGLEASGAVLFRPWRWTVLQADVRSAHRAFPSGCTLVGYPIDTAYAVTGRRMPLNTSTFRAGVETPLGLPLVRATAGIGRVWGSPALPVTMFGVAVGTRGKHVRVVLEAERLRARVKAEEVHNDFTFGAVVQRIPIVVHPVWHSARLGVEIPLR